MGNAYRERFRLERLKIEKFIGEQVEAKPVKFMCRPAVNLISLLILLFISGCQGFRLQDRLYEKKDPTQNRLSQRKVVEGVSIHYYDSHPSGGAEKILLCIHGWCGSAIDFLPMFDRMPNDVRLIALDLPGHGLSEKPDIRYTIQYYISFFSGFVRALGLEKFVLIGHSMGGQISVHFSVKFPDLVEKVILISPLGLEGEGKNWLFLARLGPLVDLGMMLNNRLFLRVSLQNNVFYDAKKLENDYLNSVAERNLSPEGRRSAASITRNVFGADYVNEELPKLKKRVLIIWGSDDRLLAASWGVTFQKLLPSASLVLLAQCGHAPTVEKPDETAGLILDFIRQ